MVYKSKYRAYAKINLTLNVIGKRPDGYHELESVMQAVSLYDDVEVRVFAANAAGATGGATDAFGADIVNIADIADINISISTTDDFIATQDIPADRHNTAYRAAEEFLSLARMSGGGDGCGGCGGYNRRFIIDININKRIPAAAGLGGGSADAAAVLLALNDIAADIEKNNLPGENRLKPLSANELLSAATKVGADVPFCLLYGTANATEPGTAAPPTPAIRTAYARGVGEYLEPLTASPPAYAVALVNPRFEISTAQVFADFTLPDEAEIKGYSQLTRAMIKSHGGGWRDCFNVLERAIGSASPRVNEIKTALLNAGALCAVMSGSGPTVFGLFEDRDAANRAAAASVARGEWAAACGFVQ
jgi:4-diphosphocytidyl-2-C-methyl-D-erythritol kinase